MGIMQGASQLGPDPAEDTSVEVRPLTPENLSVELSVMSPETKRWLFSDRARRRPDGTRIPRRELVGKKHSASSLVGLFNAQGGLCCYCCQPMTLPQPKSRRNKWPTDAEVVDMEKMAPAPVQTPYTEVTRDHLLAKSAGGPGLLSNFAAACRLCNEEKGDLPLVIFLLGMATNTVREMHRQRREVRFELTRQALFPPEA